MLVKLDNFPKFRGGHKKYSKTPLRKGSTKNQETTPGPLRKLSLDPEHHIFLERNKRSEPNLQFFCFMLDFGGENLVWIQPNTTNNNHVPSIELGFHIVKYVWNETNSKMAGFHAFQTQSRTNQEKRTVQIPEMDLSDKQLTYGILKNAMVTGLFGHQFQRSKLGSPDSGLIQHKQTSPDDWGAMWSWW